MHSFCTRTVIVVLAALLTFSCAERPDRYWFAGIKHQQNKAWADAEIQFRKVLQLDPQYKDAHLELGRSLLAQSRGTEALQEFTEAVRKDPNNATAKRFYSELTLAAYLADPQRPASRLQALIRIAEEEIKANPASYEGWRLSGLLARSQGRPDEAIVAFRKALLAKPSDEEVGRLLAQALALNPETQEEAVRTWKSTIEQQPKSWTAYEELSSFHQKKSQLDAAEEVLRGAMRQLPGSTEPYVRLAQIHFRSGKLEQARALLEELAADAAKFPGGKLAAADAYYAANDFENALRIYRSGWQSPGPQRKTFGKRTLRTLSAIGRMDEARTQLKEVLALDPKDIEVRTAEALLELDRNQTASAIELLQKLAAENSASSTLRYHLGRAYAKLGDATKAAAAWRESVRLSPGSPEPRVELARLSLQLGRAAEALEAASTVLQLEPEHSEALHLRIAALQSLGRWNEAKSAHAEYRKLFPQSATAELDEAAFHLKDRKFAEAERIFKKYHRPGLADLQRLTGYARALVAQGKSADALRLIEDEARLSPDNRLLQYVLADTYWVNGKLSEAKSTLTALLRADPKFYLAGMRLGLLLQQEGKPAEALQVLEATRKESPERVEPQAVIAQVQEQLGNWDGAKNAYREVLRVQPQNPAAALSLANVIAEHGAESELAEALRLAQLAKLLVPSDPRVLDTLGLVYLRRNEKSLAIAEFQSALRQQPANPRIKQHLAAALRN